MNTPLQKAATALMDAMVQTDFTCRLGEQLDALEKALEAEQAQAVEQVSQSLRPPRTAQEFKFGMEVLNWNRAQQDPPIDIGRELWVADEVFKLTEQAQAVEPVWVSRLKCDVGCTKPEHCRDADKCSNDWEILHPAPPSGEQIDWRDMYLKQKSEKEAMAAKYEKDIGPLARVVPAAPTLKETLAAHGIKLRTEFEPKPREHVEDNRNMVGERAELITNLRELIDLHAWAKVVADQAADMLEADVSLINEGNKAQQVSLPAGYALVPTEALLSIKGRVNTLATMSLKAERYSVGRAIKQDIADMLAAAQGEKP